MSANQRINFGFIDGSLLLIGLPLSKSGATLWPLFVFIPGLIFLAVAMFGRAEGSSLSDSEKH